MKWTFQGDICREDCQIGKLGKISPLESGFGSEILQSAGAGLYLNVYENIC